MFRPMAITVALALGGALAFSLTAFPALARASCSRAVAGPRQARGRFGRLAAALRRAARPRAGAAGGHAGAGRRRRWPLATAVAGASLGAEFVPRLDEGELRLDVKRLPSISITEAQRLGVQVGEVLARFPEVKSIVTRTGRAEVATDPVGPDETEVNRQAAPEGRVDQRARPRRARREDEARGRVARCRRRSSAVSPADRRSRQSAPGRLARRRRRSRCSAAISRSSRPPPTQIGRVIARRAGARRSARAARARAAAARGARPTALRMARYGVTAEEVLQVVEASRVGRRRRPASSRARAASISSCCCRRRRLTPEAFGELPVGTPSGSWCRSAQLARRSRETRRAGGHQPRVARAARARRGQRARPRSRSRSSTRRAAACTPAVALPPGVHLEWGGQFENFDARLASGCGVVVPHRARRHLRHAVPHVRRAALGGGGVRRRAAGARRRRAGAVAARAAVLHSGGGRLHRRAPASPCSTASSWRREVRAAARRRRAPRRVARRRAARCCGRW